MIKTRIIPTLLLNGGSIVKTVNFKDPRIVGDPVSTIKVFANRMADELCIVDIGENNKHNINQLKNLASIANMPLTIGGKISSIEIAHNLYDAGADKLMIRSLFYEDQNIIKEITKKYGNQSVVYCLDYIKDGNDKTSIYGKNNNNSGGNIFDDFKRSQDMGIGEVYLNNINLDGTMKGYDIDTIYEICKISNTPVIAAGGCGSSNDALLAIQAGASAISAGSLFYWVGESIISLKKYLSNNGISIRKK